MQLDCVTAKRGQPPASTSSSSLVGGSSLKVCSIYLPEISARPKCNFLISQIASQFFNCPTNCNLKGQDLK